MADDPLKAYLRGLRRELSRRDLDDRLTLEEIESHLLESVDQGLADGLSLESAQQRALQRFGSVPTVAAHYSRARRFWMYRILWIVAPAIGLLIAYVDSLPRWDDTGITALALLVASGLLGMLSPRRPWLWALLVGAWIPLAGIFFRHDPTMLIVLIFPFAGAYAGMLANRLLRKVRHPA